MVATGTIAAWLEGFAPRALAESWDNVGLLWGDARTEVDRVMTCLTVTDAVAAEAVEAGAGLIVSHHPVLFRGAKQVRGDRPEGAALWRLARANIAVASPHTAFDNTRGGINDLLAKRVGLVDLVPLRMPSASTSDLVKIVVFTPASDHSRVLEAAFEAGAGRIGDYRECSFAAAGVGTFFGETGTNPTVGRPGRREETNELRVEMVCPRSRLAAALAAIRVAHSYEEPAIDVFAQVEGAAGPGVGRAGRLDEPCGLERFARRVARILHAPGLQFVGDPSRLIRRVAVACGAGDDFLNDAARADADVLLTGEARFHRALEAEAIDVALIAAGHHATERPGIEDLAERLRHAFPTLNVWPSRREADPWRVLADNDD